MPRFKGSDRTPPNRGSPAFRLKVHLIWDFDRGGVTSEACLSRAYVYVGDIHLGQSLQHYTLVGMCTCVCEGARTNFGTS
jgi:hypothetical protein